ncbi:MAG: hypothetical protein JNM09_31075, partial [Blastocatellia bacterium]|nr:hypothetical protein [Blastocatellia bacterium]
RSVTVPPTTLEWLKTLAWPGNVRELENAVERAVTLNASGRLLPEDFTQFTPTPFLQISEMNRQAINPVPAGHSSPNRDSWQCAVPLTLDEVERQHIVATLRYTEGNKLRAAELLGIGRYSLYRKAERLGIDLDSLSIRPN